MLIVDDRIRVPLRELRFTFARSSGPGGQNVNKVNTKATLHWAVATTGSLPDDVRQRLMQRFRRRINSEGQLVIQSQRFRDQGRNVADCLEKLRAMLQQVAQPPKKRVPTRPSRRAKQRRLDDKRSKARTKQLRRRPGLDDG